MTALNEQTFKIKVGLSITAKLFYLMASVIFLMVAGMSIQSSSKIRGFLTQNVQDGSLGQANLSAMQIANYLNSIVAKTSVVLPRLASDGKSEIAESEITSFLRNDSEILSASVVYQKAGVLDTKLAQKSPYPGSGISEKRYAGLDPEIIKSLTLQIQAKATAAYAKNPRSTPIQVKSISSFTGLPLMLVTLRFEVENRPDDKVFISLALWQTRILVALPSGRYTESSVIDENGNLFASSDISRMTDKSVSIRSPLIETALARKSPSGFLDTYEATNGKQRLGSFAQVEGYPNLFVLVEKESDAAFLPVFKSYYSASLWAVLFTLVAIILSFISAGGATRKIKELVTVTGQIARGDLDARAQTKTNDEIAELAGSVNNMAMRIKALLVAEVEKARYEKELETARMVQSTFFPKRDIRSDPLMVTGFYQPATECGGDLWGHFKVDETRQLLFIADAMGHGAPAALVTAMGYAICQSVAILIAEEPHLNCSPSRLLERLNKIIFEAVEGKISMTFFASLFDFHSGEMTYANAGHNFPLILTPRKDDPRVLSIYRSKQSNKYPINLQARGNPLGIEKAPVFKEEKINLSAGDQLFFFTDGLIENHIGDGPQMGRKALTEFITNCEESDCFELKEKTITFASQFFESTGLADDVTIVVADISATWKPNT